MPALLELRNVRKAFGSVTVADDLTFALGEAESLGVVGPNGAGKTSMLNLITGNVALDDGQVFFEGRDITSVAAHTRAQQGIARTHQVPRPFAGMTVFENVLVGATFAGATRSRAGDPVASSVSSLERTGLLERANTPASSLPLLDRKRLELARALATQPRVLLLDEIAGGLSEPEVHELVGLIRALPEDGIAVLWIEHVVQALIAGVSRLMAMDFGRVLADGEPRAVMASPEVQAVYMGQEMEMVEL
ncbi:MAG TPA: ABC transporter ATP-binding protein [Candidatus Limnocylindria bacterium]|nr:ABC transporter ATP-binding protein [Candidatus Limnocylindria bacterium]